MNAIALSPLRAWRSVLFSKMNKYVILTGLIFLACNSFSQDITVRPKEIDDVLLNPGIGFMTFQRFNGDDLNPGNRWTEGFPISYQKFDGDLTNKDFPETTIAYWRVYWRHIEPEKGKYRWDLVDQALKTAHDRGQTLMMRIAPYGLAEKREILIYPADDSEDVPDWYRQMVGPDKNWKVRKWLVDPEDPRYSENFGSFITSFARRYDGHPDLESVDMALVGAWGEGDASDQLTSITREALVKPYTDNFKKTPLIALLTDAKTNDYIRSQTNAGWRVDCIGNLGLSSKTNLEDWFHHNLWAHMFDIYPQQINASHVQMDWLKAPLSFEICSTFGIWLEKGYDKEDVRYIFDQALKWHMSSFNAKSSPVPDQWKDLVDDWLKKMGYRFVLRQFTYPERVKKNGKLTYRSWWENKGVAPCYKDFSPALRLVSVNSLIVLPIDSKLIEWLPGDIILDGEVFIPIDAQAGAYELQIGITDKQNFLPTVKLAIEGKNNEGWYPLGKINITE